MTQTQKNELEKALDRLAKSNLKATAVDLGKRVVYLVASQSEANAFHCVYLNDGKFVCDCKYGRVVGKVCIHKAAAYVASDLNTQQEVDRTEFEAANGHDVFDTEYAMTEQATQFLDDHNRDNWLPVQGNQAMHLYR